MKLYALESTQRFIFPDFFKGLFLLIPVKVIIFIDFLFAALEALNIFFDFPLEETKIIISPLSP